MDRLALVNTTRTVPMILYKSGDLPEINMRKILLGFRFREEVRSTDGAPELFYRWVHMDEWIDHHDKPSLRNYGSISEIMSSSNPEYCLVEFFHPEVYSKQVAPNPDLPRIGTKSLAIRRFNRTYVDFLNKNEAAYLDAWIDELLDSNEKYIATYDGKGPDLVPLESERFRNGNLDIVIEDCLLNKKTLEPPRKRRRSPGSELFSSDSSDDESPLPSPSPSPPCSIILPSPLPIPLHSNILDPPTGPRIVDLTHE